MLLMPSLKGSLVRYHRGIINGDCSGADLDVYLPKNIVERASDRKQALDQVRHFIPFMSTD
jgi:hypothetical protein